MNSESQRIETDPFSYYARLARLKEFVEENYPEEINATKAARATGLSKKYFSVFFHDKVGVTFSGWLRRYRISKAKEMLNLKNWNVTRVAFEVGFRDYSTFVRVFKSCENLTPSEYKKRVCLSFTSGN